MVDVDLEYWDVPPSLNVHARGNHFAYSRAKKRWGEIFDGLLLVNCRHLKGAERVRAVATLTFTTSRRRDAGNFRFMLEKALGDSLTKGGYLPDDTFEYFQFGAVRFDKGPRPVTRLRLRFWMPDRDP